MGAGAAIDARALRAGGRATARPPARFRACITIASAMLGNPDRDRLGPMQRDAGGVMDAGGRTM